MVYSKVGAKYQLCVSMVISGGKNLTSYLGGHVVKRPGACIRT